jgi:hypothetical protein
MFHSPGESIHKTCCNIFSCTLFRCFTWFSQKLPVISLNNTDWMFFLMIIERVLCEVGSNILRMISAWLINQAIPVTVRSKAWVFGRWLAGIVGSNPAGGWMNFSRGCCMCCSLEVSATGRSLVQRSRTKCGVSECEFETSTLGRPWPIRAVETWEKKIINQPTDWVTNQISNKEVCN